MRGILFAALLALAPPAPSAADVAGAWKVDGSVTYNGTTDSATTMKGNVTVMGNAAGSFTAKKR